MMKLDHLRIPVTDLDRSRAWYTDVDATHTGWRERGVAFAHEPRKTYWGHGAELADPDGDLVRLWDERSMREK